MPPKDYIPILNDYVKGVVSGKIPACRWVKLACERHKRDLASSISKSFPYRFDEEKACKPCRFIELLPHVKGKWAIGANGKPQLIELQPWQVFIVASIFGWVKKSNGKRRFHKARIYVPRKNGKSILGAGIGLYMAFADGEAGSEVYSGATSEKQAWEVFSPARQMCLKREDMTKHLGVSVNAQSLVKEKDNSKFLPIIGKLGDGSSPHCAIIDEYHEHKTSELIDTMETGMGARDQPLSLVISTAGSNISSPCREDWKACERILENTGGFEDETTFCIIYAIDGSDRWDSEESLIKANPNWGISINAERMLAELKVAQQTARKQGAFKTKYLNLWVAAKEGFFNITEWDALKRDIKREDYKEYTSYLAGDLSSKHDLTVLMQLFCLPENKFAVFGTYWITEAALDRPENQHYRNWHIQGRLKIAGEDVIDLDEWKTEAIELCEKYKVEEMPSDPNRAWGMFSMLEREGVPVVEYKNTVLTMSEPMKQLDALIRSGAIIHDGDPILAWAIANTCGKYDAKDNVYPRKENESNKIDPVVSLIFAIGRAMTRDNSTYQFLHSNNIQKNLTFFLAVLLENPVNVRVSGSSVHSQVGMGQRFRSFFKRGNAAMSDEMKENRSQIIDLGGMSSPSQMLINVLGGSSKSGAPVNEQTALGVSAVYACVSLLSDMVAKLPIELYQKTPDGPKEIKDNPGQIALSTVPSGLHTSFELRQLMMTGKGLGGNGYARVFRDIYGGVVSIEWLKPCDVTPKMWRRNNGQCEVVYQVQGVNELLTTYDIIHIKELSRDGITGVSPITLLRESIGTAISQTEAAGSLMKNGTQFPGYLTTTTTLKPDQLEDARREFNAKYSGSAKAGSIPVLNGMFDFKATNGMSMSDAQFIESRRFELQEIARHYRIPPFLIGDSTASTTWGTGIEQQTLGFLNFSLDPHLKAFEEALNRTLLTTEEVRNGYYFRFDRDELAGVSRNDTAAYFQTMRNIGVYSVNDIRAKLDEPKISKEDGGDDYGKPLNANASASKPAEEPATV